MGGKILKLVAPKKDGFLRCKDENLVEFVGANADEQLDTFIRTSECIPKTSSSYYFEVVVVNGGKDDNIVVGLSTSDAKLCPGMSANTIGIYGSDGSICQNGEKLAWGGSFTTGDVISCQISRIKDWHLRLVPIRCQFWKNGKQSGPSRYLVGRQIFPAVGLNAPGAAIKINLGEKPFIYGKFVHLFECG